MEIEKENKKNTMRGYSPPPLVCFAIKSTIMKREVTSHKRSAPCGFRKVGQARSETRSQSVPLIQLGCVFRAQRANSVRHQWLRNSGSTPPSCSLLILVQLRVSV